MNNDRSMSNGMMTSDVLDREIDLLIDGPVGKLETGGSDWVPPCNVWEDGEGFYIQLGVPGWQPHEITVDLENQTLIVKGERPERDFGHYYIKEMGGTGFMRVFRLPASIDYQKSRAVHSNGLLTVSFPKRAEIKSSRILIEAA